jgi:hypothetical protein
LRSVPTLTPMQVANVSCDSPSRARIAGTSAAFGSSTRVVFSVRSHRLQAANSSRPARISYPMSRLFIPAAPA